MPESQTEVGVVDGIDPVASICSGWRVAALPIGRSVSGGRLTRVPGVGDDSERVAESVIAEPPMRPNKLARILASAIVSSVAAAIITKLLGRRAGFVALLATASAHEVLEAPLAGFFGKHLRLMTT